MSRSIQIAIFTLAVVSAQAAITVQVSTRVAGGGNFPFLDPKGSTLPSGNRVALGVFDTSAPGFDWADYVMDPVGLQEFFTPLSGNFDATSLSSSEGITSPGGAFSVDLSFPSVPNEVLGKQLSIWVLQTGENSSSLGADLAEVIAHGVFSSDSALFTITDRFVDPFAEILGSRDVGIGSADIDLAYIGSIEANGLALAIPEPAALGLLMGGLALGLAQIRRRR